MHSLAFANAVIRQLLSGRLEIAAHSADPGPSGSPTDFEVGWPGYHRLVSVDQSWTIDGNTASNAIEFRFPFLRQGSVHIAFLSLSDADGIRHRIELPNGGFTLDATAADQALIFEPGALTITEVV